jgi:hypothetical protein
MRNAHLHRKEKDAGTSIGRKGRDPAVPVAQGRLRGPRRKGTILFVHGSSMASQPTFDLQVPGRPDSSVMEWFAARATTPGAWDNEGLLALGTRSAPSTSTSPTGADDLEAASALCTEDSGGAWKLLIYGISSGALKGRPFCAAPSRARSAACARCLCLDGRRQPDAGRAQEKNLPVFPGEDRRPIDRAFVSEHLRARPSRHRDEATIEAFAKAILALDDSVPTGTYVDMCLEAGLSSTRRN